MLLQQGGAVLPCHGSVFGYEILDRIGTQGATTCAREQNPRVFLALFLNPRREHTDRRLGQGCASLLPSFSLAADVCTRAERDVALTKVCDFGKPQASLHCGQQQGMVATSQPSVPVRRYQQSPDLRSSQKAYQWSRLPLVGNGQHPLDESGVLRDFQGRVAEE